MLDIISFNALHLKHYRTICSQICNKGQKYLHVCKQFFKRMITNFAFKLSTVFELRYNLNEHPLKNVWLCTTTTCF